MPSTLFNQILSYNSVKMRGKREERRKVILKFIPNFNSEVYNNHSDWVKQSEVSKGVGGRKEKKKKKKKKKNSFVFSYKASLQEDKYRNFTLIILIFQPHKKIQTLVMLTHILQKQIWTSSGGSVIRVSARRLLWSLKPPQIDQNKFNLPSISVISGDVMHVSLDRHMSALACQSMFDFQMAGGNRK